jgi:HD-GYP domain-containing protein (c-di-GMP phosphodiesterase class II)
MKPALARLELHHGPGFGDHGSRVAVLARATAHHLGLNSQETSRLRLAALVHDVGKTEIDPTILEKRAELTDDESATIRRHPSTGHDQLVDVVHSSVADAVLCHHERWDGAGFPNGLTRSEIPLFARIVFVADAYDVMTTGRSYRLKMSAADAGEELGRLAGSQFDPRIVDAFASLRRELLAAPNAALRAI